MRRTYSKMPEPRSRLDAAKQQFSIPVILSYILDWVVLLVAVGIGAVLDHLEPNKRPFSLNDPNISFPYTEHEAVPLYLLLVLMVLVPVAIIFVVCLVFVPGATVPAGTPSSLIWKRKLWELHVGWLGLLLAVGSAFFFTSGMKNLFGKPRPDLLDRCQPDIANAADHVVGGFSGENVLGLLYSASICTQKDSTKLDDGFRSYPSGHSSGAASGLIYLSLFLASKFAVTIPFVVPQPGSDAISHSAFPSRLARQSSWDENTPSSSPITAKPQTHHNASISSFRRQAAAPPIYLLVIVLAPFCASVYIASSRWYDFRHHGFDILFGYIMGTITAIYSFRYYHLPIQEGAGWAWAPRSPERAFWAGVGRLGYVEESPAPSSSGSFGKRVAASNDIETLNHPSQEGTTAYRPPHHAAGGYAPSENYSEGPDAHYGQRPEGNYSQGPYENVEMHSMNNRF